MQTHNIFSYQYRADNEYAGRPFLDARKADYNDNCQRALVFRDKPFANSFTQSPVKLRVDDIIHHNGPALDEAKSH